MIESTLKREPEDYARLSGIAFPYLLLDRSGRRRYFWCVTLYFSGLAGSIICGLFAVIYALAPKLELEPLFFLGLFGTLCLIVFVLFRQLANDLILSKDGEFLSPALIKLDDKGLAIKNSTDEAFLSWSKIKKVVHDQDQAVLMADLGSEGFQIPMRCLEKGQWGAIKELAKNAGLKIIDKAPNPPA